MTAIFNLLDRVLEIYQLLIFIWVILSWLRAFGYLPLHNYFLALVWDFLHRITEPFLYRIRRFMPAFGGVDLSPIVLLLLVMFLRELLNFTIRPLFV